MNTGSNKGSGLVIGIIIVAIVVIGGISWSASRPSMSATDSMVKTDTMMKKDVMVKPVDVMKKESATMEATGTMMKKDDTSMSSKGSYEAYSPEKLMLAAQGKVVLFFHAPWCPYCRATDSDILKNISTIPVGFHILKLDYDTSRDLEKKYSVTSQHTFVQVDAQGAVISKWVGASSLQEIINHTK